MSTSFSSLPVVDIGALKHEGVSNETTQALSKQLYDVFATTGFAYLVNAPLSFDHEEIFGLAKEFFNIPLGQRMSLAKKSFRPGNANTYRGYFPTQAHLAPDNLKEGFEIGSSDVHQNAGPKDMKINLSERNVWPSPSDLPSASRAKLEQAYTELQSLAKKLLSLLALSLDRPSTFFDEWLENSLSTLRLLHYPAVPYSSRTPWEENRGSKQESEVKLSCTPHTDSGIITLLHQDDFGGLEVLNASNEWIAAPYVPGSLVVNIGDLMAKVSGGRFVATVHRVRAPEGSNEDVGRFSIPFFFEPGEDCVIDSVEGDGEPITYGEHVRKKMSNWVEFQEDSGYDTGDTATAGE